MKAMILAAGRGARFRPVTDTLPKPLIPVCGEVLIERHLKRLAAAGVKQFVINLGWLGEQIERALGDGSRFGVEIKYSTEGWPALETGGGVFRALPLLGPEPFLVVSGDIWSELPVGQLLNRRLAPNDLAHLVLVPKDGYHPDFCLDGGRVRNPPATGKDGESAAEDRLSQPPEYTFGNYSILRPELFDGCKDGAFPIGPMWHAAADHDRVSGEVYTGPWWNLGTPQQVAQLEAQLQLQRKTA